jgi:molybdopterin biosynthesis enzyme MoaB
VGPRDETPEGTARVITQDLPGIAEELRRIGATETPGGMLSRGRSGVAGPIPGITAGALIVNLPGSPKAVASGMPVVVSVARHVIDQLAGGDHA